MGTATDEVLAVYLETRDYHETAVRLGMKYDAVRKQVKKHLPPGSSSLIKVPDSEISLQWLRTPKEGATVEEIVDAVRDAFSDYVPPEPILAATEDFENELATVYPLADLHVGMLSWAHETGTDWDTAIARKTIQATMERLVAGAPQSQQGVVLGLGDLLHADNFDGQTSKSKNILDVDGRYPKILKVAAKLIIYIVDLALQRHKQVLVRILPGNHDAQSAHAITLALALHYENHSRVTVDDSASNYWFWRWGKVFLGATHGHEAKAKDMPLIMATERKKDWAASTWRHCYMGHVHTQTAIENRGVTVESFNTPIPADAWHAGKGYSAGRSLTCITHDKDRGEIMRQKVNI